MAQRGCRATAFTPPTCGPIPSGVSFDHGAGEKQRAVRFKVNYLLSEFSPYNARLMQISPAGERRLSVVPRNQVLWWRPAKASTADIGRTPLVNPGPLNVRVTLDSRHCTDILARPKSPNSRHSAFPINKPHLCAIGYRRSSASMLRMVGRCRAISCQRSPSSRLAKTEPLLVPKYTPTGSRSSRPMAWRRTVK
jgi:hypothetical protein